MEILFKGTHPDEIKYEATCSLCKTRVRFSRNEGRISSSYQGTYIYVTCPVYNGSIAKEIR